MSGTFPSVSSYLRDALAFVILIHFDYSGLTNQIMIINRIGRDDKYMGVRGKYNSGWNSWKEL